MKIFFAFFSIVTALLGAQEVHEGDYFVTGGDVEVSQVVTGDLFAVGSQVSVTGRIEGDVIAFGGVLAIDGEVLGNVRAIGGQVFLNGRIDKNLTAVGGNMELAPGAVVMGNALFTGNEVTLNGEVKGEVAINGSTAFVNGKIGEDMKARVGHLQVGPQSIIRGDLDYSSGGEAKIDQAAQVRGEIVYHSSHLQKFWSKEWKKRIIFSTKLLGLMMNFLFSFAFGALYILMFPHAYKHAIQVLKKRPMAAAGVGLLTLIVLPLLCLLLLVSILGIPIGLTLIALSLLTFYTAKVLPILWLTGAILPKLGIYWSLLVGLIGYFILMQIPFVGGIVSFVFILLGIGAALLGRNTRKRAAS